MPMNCMVFKAAADGKLDILRRTEHLEDQLTPNKNTVLHIHITGGMARTDCVLAILLICPSLLRQKNSKDETPLHMAAKEGLTQIVKVLVDQVKALDAYDTTYPGSGMRLAVKELVGMRNEEGDTALHEAVRYRRQDVVKLLIGEDPEFEYGGNNAGETPLYMAVKRGFDELVDEILTASQSPAHDGPNGLTALHLAIICGDDKGQMGRKILNAMPNLVTKTDEKGWTPLHYAAHFDKVTLVEELLKKDQSAAYIADKVGKIPLHIAASRSHIQIMEKIISYCPDCSEVVDDRRRNVLHLAVKERKRKSVEHILKYYWGRNLVNEKDADGNTPLHLFAASFSFIPTLIMSPHDLRVDKMAVNKSGLTVADILSSNTEAPLLKVAGTRMSREVYKAAVEGEVDRISRSRVEHLDGEVTPNNNTVLHILITGGMATEDCVSKVVRRCPSLLWKKNDRHETALHMAAKEGLTQIVKLLIDHVKDLHADDTNLESGMQQLRRVKEMVETRNMEGDTALHEAVRYRRLGVVKLLIGLGGDPPELEIEYCSTNKAGETPLYMAVKRNFDELVGEILKTCKSPADYDGPNGLTALHQAIISSDAKGEVVSKILAKMSYLTKSPDNQNGWTPLHYASYLGKVSQAEQLLKKDLCAAYMPDKVGKIPLHIAASRNQVQVMEKVILYYPDCSEMVDNKGCNVLHMAVQTRSKKAMKLILENSWGSNLINGRDVNGNTPLHIFASSSMLASFLYLVPTLILTHPRVDISAVNNDGLTAADILSSNSRGPFLIKALIQLVLKINNRIPALPNVINDGGNDPAAKAKVSEIKKASKIHLIVAALIATVAYAAGFTLPGGFNEDKGPHRGMAVLAKKASFVAFYITDGIAMLLSTIAVVIHFFMTLEEEWEKLNLMLNVASYSTLLSMGFMLAAFTMAACAVLFNFNAAPIIFAVFIVSFTFALVYFAWSLLTKLVVRKL